MEGGGPSHQKTVRQFKNREEVSLCIKSEYAGENFPKGVDQIEIVFPSQQGGGGECGLMSDKLHILDVPGIEDEDYYKRLQHHLKKSIN